MAVKEVYRIGIQVGVDGVEESKQKLSAMEKYTQQTEKRMKALNKILVSPTAKIKDQASSAIEKISLKSRSLSRAIASPTAKLNDQATSKLNRISTTIKRLENTNITANLRINDQTASYLNKVQAKRDKFKNTNINPTARVSVSDEASPKLNNIKNTEDKIKDKKVKVSVEDQATSTITNIENKINGWIKSGAKKVIALGTAGVIAAGGFGVGESIKTYSEYEKGLSNVKAVTGATSEQMQQLDGAAKKFGSTTQWAARSVTSAEELLGQAGFSVNETISALPGLLNLASAGDLDLATATDIASGTIKAFSLNASDASHVADVLALSASATNSDVTDLGESMKYVAPVSQSLGISLEDTAAAVGLLSNANIKGSQSGTVLRQTMARLASPTDAAAKYMQMYGINAFDAQGNMKPLSGVIDNLNSSLGKLTSQQRANIISTIFGTESMSGVLALMNQGGKSVGDLSQQLKDANDAAQQMADTKLDNLQGQWIKLKAAVEHMQITLGEKLAPYAKEFVTWLTGKMPELTDDVVNFVGYISNHTGEIKFWAETIIGLSAAFVGFSAIGKIGTTLSGISSFMNLFKGAKIAEETAGIASGLSKVGLLGRLLPVIFNPAGAAITASVALVGSAVATNNELMTKSFDTSTDDLSTWQKVINTLTGSTLKSKKELQDAGLAYEDFSSSLSGKFKDSVEEASKSYNKLKMTLAFDSRNGIDSLSDSMANDIKSQVDVIVKSAKDAVQNKSSEMQDTLSKLFTLSDGTIDDSESNVMDNIAEYQNSKFDTIQNLNQNIYDTLNTAVDAHKKLTEDDINNIKNWSHQIQALQIEANTSNDADERYTSNQSKFEKRLGSMTPDESLSSMKDSYNQIIDINQDKEDKSKKIIDSSKNIKENLEKDYNEAIQKGDTKTADSMKNSIDVINQKVKGAQDDLNKSLEERQKRTKDLWAAFYSVNSNLQGKINEVNFTKFTGRDIKANDKLNSKLSNEFSQIADTTQTGMKRIKEANGWHDIEVTVDESTGKITSIYDTFNGDYAGYSEEFAQKAKETGDKTRSSMEELEKSLTTLGGGIKLDSNNDVLNSTTDEFISKLDNVITKADGAKMAIANVNGTQLKLEFDKDGLLTNYNDVIDAINGDKNSKAIVDIDVNDNDALNKLKDTEDAANQIPTNKDIQISSNADETTNDINNTTTAINEVPKEMTTDVWLKDHVTQPLSGILNNLEYMVSHPWTAFVNAFGDGNNSSNYTPTDQDTYDENRTRLGGDGLASGTNNATRGWHDTAEQGFEIMVGRKKRWFNGGEQVLTHEKSKKFLQDMQSNEPSEVEQGQFQLAPPKQVQVAGGGGINIPITIQAGSDPDVDSIVQQATQEVSRKLKEAFITIKK
ncbi:phage tail tape measure protein [uncultured Clostridium sp.]|uniref:phage tail tape measure protein n=1 Tax=uncultured Clostridium sp. TaxID=59620 RepID=UPI0028F09B1D|nr:phage tail tape measure protein [uncultured Clostridium sp.]